jgi:hypothetical protein
LSKPNTRPTSCFTQRSLRREMQRIMHLWTSLDLRIVQLYMGPSLWNSTFVMKWISVVHRCRSETRLNTYHIQSCILPTLKGSKILFPIIKSNHLLVPYVFFFILFCLSNFRQRFARLKTRPLYIFGLHNFIIIISIHPNLSPTLAQ